MAPRNLYALELPAKEEGKIRVEFPEIFKLLYEHEESFMLDLLEKRLKIKSKLEKKEEEIKLKFKENLIGKMMQN